jgi:hypothetical protein
MEVMPIAKKSSEREQDLAKKSKHERKKRLLNLFGDGAHVPAPTNKGTPIDAVVQCRKNRGKGDNTPNKAEAGDKARMRQKCRNQANWRQMKQLDQTMRHQIKAQEQVKQRHPKKVGRGETLRWTWS